MPIASYKPTIQPEVIPNLPEVEPTHYQSSINDDKFLPLRSLLAYVEGAPWYVDYYSQVVSAHNDLREIDPGQNAVYQQYRKIIGMELRVSSALDTSYDSETGITSSRGNGLVYTGMTPNIFDYFITDAGDDRKAIFKITNVERKTFNRDSAFAVDYILVGYVKDLTEIFTSLETKTIRTYHFDKGRLVDGLQPLVTESVYNQLTSLRDWYIDIVNYYFKNFFHRSYMTLVLPGQTYAVYDSMLVDYLLKIVDTFDAPEIRQVRQLTTDRDIYLKQPQFWSIMLEKSYSDLQYCNQTMGIVHKKTFNSSPFIHGAAFGNIDYLIYPDTPEITALVESGPDARPLSFIDVDEVANAKGTLVDLLGEQYVVANTTYSHIHTVNFDNYYVLSKNFYDNTVGQSLLEILTKDYLKLQTLNLDMLLTLCGRYKNWGRLEQFYYGPILLTLIKEADRAIY